MKNFLASIGVGRFVGIASMVSILVGAMVATPIVASADESDDGNGADGETVVQRTARVFHGADRDVFDYYPDLTQPGDDEDGDENGEYDDTDSPSGDDPIPPGSGDDIEAPGESAGEPAGIDVEAVLSFDAEGQSLGDYLALFGLSEAGLADAALAGIQAQVAAAVESGELTQEQADQILASASEDVPALLGSGDEADDAGDAQDDQFELSLDVVAELTGADVEEVSAALDSGQTLAEFAAGYGVGSDELISALVADIEGTITQAVESGELTQEEADDMLAGVVDWVTAMVNDSAAGDDVTGQPPASNATGETPDSPDQIADLAGATASDLLSLLASGQALADLAAEQGVSVDELVAAVVAEVEAQVSVDVENGGLAQKQADQILGSVDWIVTSLLSLTGPDESTSGMLEGCAPLPLASQAAGMGAVASQLCPAGS